MAISRAEINAYFADWTPAAINDLPDPIRDYLMRIHSHIPEDAQLLTWENGVLYTHIAHDRSVISAAPMAEVCLIDGRPVLQFTGAPTQELHGDKWNAMMSKLLEGKTVALVRPMDLKIMQTYRR